MKNACSGPLAFHPRADREIQRDPPVQDGTALPRKGHVLSPKRIRPFPGKVAINRHEGSKESLPCFQIKTLPLPEQTTNTLVGITKIIPAQGLGISFKDEQK